ncbi:hypothetical protein JL720_5079 [Aureococcus anophagefferens]|nr:hypothetical protein JL720_5079 [Aureococcus anophagefferens]
MIDVDQSGSLDKAEVKAVKTDQKVIKFLRPEWEEAIESALANKLEARAAKREAQAKAARKEIEEFTSEFVSAARKCFEMIDKDNSGTLTKVEIVKAIAEDKDVVKFLKTCGEEISSSFCSRAAREGAPGADTSNDGELDVNEWEDAIQRGLAKRLDDLANERGAASARPRRRTKRSVEFLSAARQVFDAIDVDQSGSLDKAEVVKAVKTDQKVIKFLVNCGNQNLQWRCPRASKPRSTCAGREREAQAKAARKEIEEFTSEFVSAARKCFEMIDKDNSGTLTKVEIVKAIAEDKDVVKFLKTCGEENLQFLLFPARLEKALQVLDTSNDGELDVNEWEDAIQRGLAKRLDDLANERERRERAAQAEDEAFSVEFLSAARQVFDMIDVDQSGSLDKRR